jgi:uncharacterized surface protein with fasciclin (FAS1) repeats
MKRTYFTGFIVSFAVVVSLALVSCSKATTAGNGSVGNRLTNVVTDNFNFSLFTAAINYTGLADTLLQPGPYTALVPNDDAFHQAGYSNAVAIQATDLTFMRAVTAYHILKGTYQFNRLPYAFDQEIKTLQGNSMYVTHWIKNGDSVVTINGTRILSYNLPASNGLVQVLSAVLSPAIYNNLHDAVAADPALTFFNTALARTGLSSLLESGDTYTVFAPTNAAFIAMGIPTLDSIYHTNTSVLANLVRYHILSARRFIYDYILITDATGKSQQAMVDGNNVTITLYSDPNTGAGVNSILLQGSGNNGATALVRRDILAGNGVLHTINQVLKTNY